MMSQTDLFAFLRSRNQKLSLKRNERDESYNLLFYRGLVDLSEDTLAAIAEHAAEIAGCILFHDAVICGDPAHVSAHVQAEKPIGTRYTRCTECAREREEEYRPTPEQIAAAPHV